MCFYINDPMDNTLIKLTLLDFSEFKNNLSLIEIFQSMSDSLQYVITFSYFYLMDMTILLFKSVLSSGSTFYFTRHIRVNSRKDQYSLFTFPHGQSFLRTVLTRNSSFTPFTTLFKETGGDSSSSVSCINNHIVSCVK